MLCRTPRCELPVAGAGEPYGLCEQHGRQERNRRLAARDAADAAREAALEAFHARPQRDLSTLPTPAPTRRQEPDVKLTPFQLDTLADVLRCPDGVPVVTHLRTAAGVSEDTARMRLVALARREAIEDRSPEGTKKWTEVRVTPAALALLAAENPIPEALEALDAAASEPVVTPAQEVAVEESDPAGKVAGLLVRADDLEASVLQEQLRVAVEMRGRAERKLEEALVEREALRAKVAELEATSEQRERYWQEILDAKNGRIGRLERQFAAVEAERDADREIAERTIARLNGLAVEAQPEGGLEHAAVRVLAERDELAKQVGAPGGNGHLHDEIRDLRSRLEQAEKERDIGAVAMDEAHDAIDGLAAGIPSGPLETRIRALAHRLTRPVKQVAAPDVVPALEEAANSIAAGSPGLAAFQIGVVVGQLRGVARG